MSATGSFGTPTIRGRGLRVEATFFTGAARSGVRSAVRSGLRSPPSLGVVVVVVVVVVVSSVIFYLPTRLRHARQLAAQRVLTEAHAAQSELDHVGPRPAAHLAAVVPPHLELRRPL